MGCCTSREASASPYAPQPQAPTAPDSSRAAINTPQPLPSRASRSASHSSAHAPGVGQPSTARPRTNPSTRPNKPLRLPSPVRKCPPERALQPWNRTQLAKERDAFFETRVTGDAQVWEALRLVCESLRNGDEASAQNLLDTVGCTCPTGRIKSERASPALGAQATGRKGGIFDERGNEYRIPGWVIVDPDDLIEEDDDDGEKEEGIEDEEEDEVEERESRRDEKGKGKVEEVGETVTVTARLSDRASDVVVAIGKQQKVRVLIRRIQEKASITSRIKIVYLGKVLEADKTLEQQGFAEGHVVNALVFGD